MIPAPIPGCNGSFRQGPVVALRLPIGYLLNRFAVNRSKLALSPKAAESSYFAGSHPRFRGGQIE